MLPRLAGLWLLCLAFPGAVLAQEKQARPLLVLDAGGHTSKVWQLLFTPGGKEVLSVSADGTVRVWDVVGGDTLRTLHLPRGAGQEGTLSAAALSPDGQLLAVGGHSADRKKATVFLIRWRVGQIERTLRGHTGPITGLAFAFDGRRLASSSNDHTARLWDVSSGTCTHVLQGHTDILQGVAFAPDGRRLATASFDTTARLWSAETGRSEAVLSGHVKKVGSVAWSRDGKTLATGGYDHTVRLWNADGTPRQVLAELDSPVTTLTFTPGGRGLLATLGGTTAGGSAVLLDAASGAVGVRFTQHKDHALAGAVSPDGKLAATGDRAGDIFVLRTGDGSLVHRLGSQGRPVLAAGWSQDGRTVAWGQTAQFKDANDRGPLERAFNLAELGLVALADPSSFRRANAALGNLSLEADSVKELTLARGGQPAATFRPAETYDRPRSWTFLDAKRAVVGTEQGLYLLSVPALQSLRSFQGHTSAVLAVAPSPDGRFLLSASADQTLRVWDPNRTEPLLSLFVAGNDWIAWTPEGYFAASPGGEKLMGWHVNNGPGRLASFFPAGQFRKSLYRPDVIGRLLEAGSLEKALLLVGKGKAAGVRTEVARVLPPRVAVTAPGPSGVRLTSADVVVRASADSVGEHPVTALRLLLNGRPYQGQESVQKIGSPQPGKAEASWNVHLTPGKFRLAVQAESAVSTGKSEEVEVVFEDAAKPETDGPEPTRLYVLAVGISAYADDLRLNYAAKDAQALAGAFQQHSEGRLFRKGGIKVLTDKEATRGKILQGLSWVRKEMTQHDVAVVFFAGHGQRDNDGSLYLLPADVDTKDLVSTGVLAHQLKTTLEGLPGRIVLILDACHSGAVDKAKTRAVAGLTDDLVRDLATDENGVVVLCGSTGREFALENNELRHGNFTQALIEGLAGKARTSADGAVYLHHLDSYVTDRVKELTQGQQHPVTSRPASVRSFPLSRPVLSAKGPAS